jgi:hypothetical protein
MNAAFNTKAPDVALGPVAVADPLWPPNLPKTAAGHAVTAPEMPAAMLQQVNSLFVPETRQ